MTTNKPRPPSKRTMARRQEKHLELLDAYLSGMKFPEMAKELGYANRSNAYRALNAALKVRAAERADLSDQVLELQLGRYEKLLETHMTIALDATKPADAARSAGVVLQIGDRMCKLLGMDLPTRHEVTVTTVDDLDREIAELAAALTAKARADGAAVDVPVLEAIIERGTPPATS